MTSAKLKQAVPFFGVTNMQSSLRFYVDELAFKMERWWIPDSPEDHPDGRICWCWLELGEAAIMLQEFSPGRQPKETLGTGVNVCSQCHDALALYREFKSRGIPTHPSHSSKHIGNQRLDTRHVGGVLVGKSAQQESFLLVQFYPKASHKWG